MKIFVVRHGYAGDYIGKDQGQHFIHNPKDLSRTLLPEGRDAASALAAWMVDAGQVPSVILHSPVARAKQTADILSRVTGAPRKEEQNLEISKPLEMVVKRVANDRDMKRVALVAHTDNIVPGLRALNWLAGADKFEVDPIAMAELRILRVDRDTFTWEELQRVLPSDLGETDYY